MQTADLNHLDELYLHLDRPDEPWGVHFEVALAEPPDAERLREAIRAAAARHPIARARLAEWSGLDTSYRWEVPDELGDVPLTVASDADAAREDLYAASPSLDREPPFAVVLAGDALMLNLHHAAGDGLSAARLTASILRAYDGQPDPVPEIDPLAVRDLGTLTSGSPADRLVRATRLVEHLVRSAGRASARSRSRAGRPRALTVDLPQRRRRGPAAIKRRLQDLIPLTGTRVVDTAVLSNLGRLDPPAHGVRAVWFSPPGRMPL